MKLTKKEMIGGLFLIAALSVTCIVSATTYPTQSFCVDWPPEDWQCPYDGWDSPGIWGFSSSACDDVRFKYETGDWSNCPTSHTHGKIYISFYTDMGIRYARYALDEGESTPWVDVYGSHCDVYVERYDNCYISGWTDDGDGVTPETRWN